MPRRTFSADYKLELIEKAARCSRRGELKMLLQREGLNTAHLTKWRAIATEAARAALARSGSDSAAPKPFDEETEMRQLRSLVALQGRVLRRLLSANNNNLYGLDADLAELRMLAEPLGFAELIVPRGLDQGSRHL